MKWAIAVVLALPVTSIDGQAPAVTPPIPQISTSATGESRVQPDRATLQFTVETRAPTAARAAADNARRQRAVIDTLRKMGLAEGQISTSGYSVAPEMRYDGKQPQVTGYVARNSVQADLRQIDQVGPLIDAALGAGANLVSSLRFFSSKADEAHRLALADAVNRARSDADAMARAAGGSLGPVIEMATSGPARPFYGDEMAMARAANVSEADPTPIEPGEQTVRVLVSVRWTFLPATR